MSSGVGRVKHGHLVRQAGDGHRRAQRDLDSAWQPHGESHPRAPGVATPRKRGECTNRDPTEAGDAEVGGLLHRTQLEFEGVDELEPTQLGGRGFVERRRERAARLGRVHVIGVVARSAVCDAQPVRAHLGGGRDGVLVRADVSGAESGCELTLTKVSRALGGASRTSRRQRPPQKKVEPAIAALACH